MLFTLFKCVFGANLVSAVFPDKICPPSPVPVHAGCQVAVNLSVARAVAKREVFARIGGQYDIWHGIMRTHISISFLKSQTISFTCHKIFKYTVLRLHFGTFYLPFADPHNNGTYHVLGDDDLGIRLARVSGDGK